MYDVGRYIHTSYIHIYVHTHLYIHTHMHVYNTHSIYVSIYMCVRVYIHIFVYTYIHSTHVCMCVYICIYIHCYFLVFNKLILNIHLWAERGYGSYTDQLKTCLPVTATLLICITIFLLLLKYNIDTSTFEN